MIRFYTKQKWIRSLNTMHIERTVATMTTTIQFDHQIYQAELTGPFSSSVVMATIPTDMFVRRVYDMNRPRKSNTVCKCRVPNPAK